MNDLVAQKVLWMSDNIYWCEVAKIVGKLLN